MISLLKRHKYTINFPNATFFLNDFHIFFIISKKRQKAANDDLPEKRENRHIFPQNRHLSRYSNRRGGKMAAK
ncbi:MAG: hypothetical protein IJK93_08015 [Muribaculaceae bacterium]|nr:hypothetical protein [Muribaculaceae bacterium]